MKLTEEQYELIEAYLANELSATDRASLEADMQVDAEFQAEVDYQRTVREGLRIAGIEQLVDRARANYQAAQQPAEPTIVRPLQPARTSFTNWQYWVAAASVVLLLGVGYVVYQQTRPQDYTAALVSEQTDELMKGFPQGTLSAPVREQLLSALDAYRRGKYTDVIDKVKGLPETRQTVFYKQYLLGLSYLANQQPSEAIPLLNRALAAPSQPLRQKAEWMLALAYVKNKENEKALPILNRISTSKANPYQNLAKQVLQKIN